MAKPDRTAAWLRFAAEDLAVARLAAGEEIWNQVCFHAQQAAEKALKGFLEATGERVPKLHALAELVTLCGRQDDRFEALRDICVLLDRFYIPTRYPAALVGSLPEGLPSHADAEEALRSATEIQHFVKTRLSAAPR